MLTNNQFVHFVEFIVNQRDIREARGEIYLCQSNTKLFISQDQYHHLKMQLDEIRA